LSDTGAEVVVIKQGSSGATVFEAGSQSNIPAYKTTTVWPIGSGDVFSAVFTHYWVEKKATANEAANRASLATAYYCQTQNLQIPGIDNTNPTLLEFTALQSKKHVRKNIYLAGPFFTMAERWLISESRLALRQTGNNVFSPLHDVGHGLADIVVPLDLKALDECDVVFAIVDGLDSGTLFEVGYARAKGKQVVAFVQNEAPENLKMLEGSDCIICDDFSTAIYTINWI
jgi:nucleoside 2-deoxyribosyltransferase